MNLLRSVIRPYLYARYGFHRMTRTGAFRNDRTRHAPGAAQHEWGPLKQALWRYHVKQFHESSCSVASVVACINAVRSLNGNTAEPIGQRDILERVTTGHWKERMSDGGYRGRRGLPLGLLGQVVKDSIAAYALKVQAVTVVQTPKQVPEDSSIPTLLRERLRDFDRHGGGLIIAHFDQGTLLPTLNIPHISPVGAYDAATDRVTVLDVDPGVEQPYQVAFNTFYKALSCDYHHVFKPFGYGSGGYVHIRIR